MKTKEKRDGVNKGRLKEGNEGRGWKVDSNSRGEEKRRGQREEKEVH